MAEEIQENYESTMGDHLVQLFELIKDNSLDEIKQIVESLQPEQCIKIVNGSVIGYSLLYTAIMLKKVEISRYLIEISLLQGPREMSDRWKTCRHPLIAAIHSGNPELIELILQHLPNINESISGPLSPLMIAISLGNLMSVKLIVDWGAVINLRNIQGRSPLKESISQSEIFRYFVIRGANVNHRDNEGFTALHYAISGQDNESVIQLLNSGADVRIRNQEGITPLIWAAINLLLPAFMYLIKRPENSAVESIEALEILNACLICAENFVIEPWMESLKMRRRWNFPKNCQIPAREILDFSEEFTTEAELENLQGNSLRLAFQSILVVERILGRNNRLYMQFLLQTALIAKKENNMEKVRQFIDYIEEYCREISIYCIGASLRVFRSLYDELSKNNDHNEFFEYGVFALFKIIAQKTVNIWILVKDNVSVNPFVIDSYYSEIVDTFLYMTSTTKIKDFSRWYRGLFKELVTIVVRTDPRVRHHQTILHRAIKLMKTQTWSSIGLIKILLESGDVAYSRDYFQRIPIMCAVKYVPQDILKDVLALLLKYGYHDDCGLLNSFRAMLRRECVDPAITPLKLRCISTDVIFYDARLGDEVLPKIIEDSFKSFYL